MSKQIVLLALGILLLIGCKKDEPIEVISTESELNRVYDLQIPEGFPMPEIPADNPLTVGRVELGKALFYEKAFSVDYSISCASCHNPRQSFTDGKALSIGAYNRLGERNAPQLANVAYKPLFFKDGGIPTLELQALAPFDNHLEFDLNIVEAVERLNAMPGYVEWFMRVFGEEPTVYGVTRALSAFQRTFISGNSKYDQHFLQNEPTLTEQELRGYNLFTSEELKCNSCHSGVFFTDFSYRNIGLEEVYADSGRARITLNPADAGKFEVPTLRNVAVTGPYMFDGRYSSLEEVIDHFATGGVNHKNKDVAISGFDITENQKQDLIAFLNTLTDKEFLNNPAFQQPQ